MKLALGSSHLICPNGTIQGFTTADKILTLIQSCFELIDPTITTSIIPLSTETLVVTSQIKSNHILILSAKLCLLWASCAPKILA